MALLTSQPQVAQGGPRPHFPMVPASAALAQFNLLRHALGLLSLLLWELGHVDGGGVLGEVVLQAMLGPPSSYIYICATICSMCATIYKYIHIYTYMYTAEKDPEILEHLLPTPFGEWGSRLSFTGVNQQMVGSGLAPLQGGRAHYSILDEK